MKRATATLHFSELLLVLLKGKTSLADSLHILAGQGIEKQVRDCAVSLLSLMKKGKSFSESLRGTKECRVFFEPLYLTLIAAAELTGSIETVLERIVSDLKRNEHAKETIINILIYPVIIVLLAITGTAVIIFKGMPLFISGGLLSAAAMAEAKTGIAAAGAVLLSGGLTLFIVYFRIFNNDSPEFIIFYLLDFLLKSNITLHESLSHCLLNMARSKFAGALVSVKKDIASGIKFSAAFAKAKSFSPYVLGWLSVADTYSNLGDICGSIRDYYGQKDERMRETAAKLIEPAFIVLTGLYVLIIMATVILPILTYAGGVL